MQQLNQQIMGCNRWQFQELHRLQQQLKHLAQEESYAKWTDLVLGCEADKRVPSKFWQQVRWLRGNEQEEDKGVKNKKNRIKTDTTGKEETLRQHWQEIFKIQSEDNIKFDQEI